MQASTHIPRLFSAASPAKRVAVESEEIPTRVQFSAKPETERWWEFLSWTKAAKSIFRKIAPYLRPIQGHEQYHIAKNMPTFADVALILIMAL